MAISSNQQFLGNADGVFEPSVADFWSLLKPRVMSLVIFTGFAGMYVAPGSLHPLVFIVSLFAIAAGAGASGAINQWYDRDIDALMTRTKMRPIPAGVMAPAEALTMGLVVSAMAVLLLGLAANWLAAGLLAFTIFFYAVVYTFWLKRKTPQNIVIGGAAGALPPVIGWASVTGSLSFEPLVLFFIIFMWTPPHFWALALVKTTITLGQIFQCCRLLPVRWRPVGKLLFTPSCRHLQLFHHLSVWRRSVMGFWPLGEAVCWPELAAIKTRVTSAMRLFAYSIIYLFLLFLSLLLTMPRRYLTGQFNGT